MSHHTAPVELAVVDWMIGALACVVATVAWFACAPSACTPSMFAHLM
jgi:hypothetical protein